MTREVFGGRDGEFLTVGEMPGVTPEQARLYTDPARRRAEHGLSVRARSVDQGTCDKFDYLGLDLVVAEEGAAPLAGSTGRNRLEQPVLEQSRPASRGVPVR